MSKTSAGRVSQRWPLILLAAGVAALVAMSATAIGPPSSTSRVAHEVATAINGVVQTTVTGTGNVEAGVDQGANFATAGTLNSINVSVGQHVKAGQLIATLDPTAARLALDAAEAQLTAAEDELSSAESGGSSSAAGASTGSGAASSGSATQTDYSGGARSVFVSDATTTPTAQPNTTGASTTTTGASTTTTAASLRSPTVTRTMTKQGHVPTVRRSPVVTVTVTSPATPSATRATGGSRSSAASTSSGSGSPSPSSIASAQAAVDNAQASVDSARRTLAETRLYAPVSGTVASLANDAVGSAISAGSGTGAASSAASGSSSSAAGAAGSLSAGSLGGGSSATSASGFAVIVNTSTLTMTVSFSESDITRIHVGQPATVSIDALSGVELAAHVSSISPIGTSSSGVVSYNATLTLDQNNPEVRSGMSATATVITAQASGVTVPNQAVSGSGSVGTVQLMQNGRTVTRSVVVGLRGSTRTQIISGVASGQRLLVTLTLPALGTATTSAATATGGFAGGGGLRALLGAGGGLGGGAGLGGGGGLRSLLAGGGAP